VAGGERIKGQQQHVPCIKIVQAMLKTFIPFSPKFGSGGLLPTPSEQWLRSTERNSYLWEKPFNTPVSIG